jgi:ABC-type phosphate/phosphonate transport system substrate-binding protein
MNIFLLIGYLTLSTALQAKEPSTLTLGIFPHSSTTIIHDIHAPSHRAMEKALQTPIKVEITTTLDEFTQSLWSEKYDIAYIDPLMYPKAHDQYRYIPLVNAQLPQSATLVTYRASNIHTLSDIKKTHRLGFPPRQATNTRLMLSLLKNQGYFPHQDYQPHYSNNEFNCFMQVTLRLAETCPLSHVTIELLQRNGMMKRFRILAKSHEISSPIFIAHSRIPQKIRDKIRDVLVKNPLKIEPLGLNPYIVTLKKASDNEYDALRNLLKNGL